MIDTSKTTCPDCERERFTIRFQTVLHGVRPLMNDEPAMAKVCGQCAHENYTHEWVDVQGMALKVPLYRARRSMWSSDRELDRSRGDFAKVMEYVSRLKAGTHSVSIETEVVDVSLHGHVPVRRFAPGAIRFYAVFTQAPIPLAMIDDVLDALKVDLVF